MNTGRIKPSEVDAMATALMRWFRREPMLRREIATVLGVSSTRIYQIEKTAMEKIRAALMERSRLFAESRA